MKTQAESFAAHIKRLVGGKIVGVHVDPEKENFGFDVFVKGKTQTCWVLCDPEGNGPGFIAIDD